jgi:hypothetical protein
MSRLIDIKDALGRARGELNFVEDQVGVMNMDLLATDDQMLAAQDKVVELMGRIRELEAQLAPKPMTVADWLAKRGFFVDGDAAKLSLSPDNRYVHVKPGDLRCEVGPKDARLAMIGRLPQSDLTRRHIFGGTLGPSWTPNTSKVVAWQAWHTSNQNPSLSVEIYNLTRRVVHSFGGSRTVLYATSEKAAFEIRVYGWLPGIRRVTVIFDTMIVWDGKLELLPAGSTAGPVVKCGAYFPAWRDGARLAEGNVVVIPADWEAVTP